MSNSPYYTITYHVKQDYPAHKDLFVTDDLNDAIYKCNVMISCYMKQHKSFNIFNEWTTNPYIQGRTLDDEWQYLYELYMKTDFYNMVQYHIFYEDFTEIYKPYILDEHLAFDVRIGPPIYFIEKLITYNHKIIEYVQQLETDNNKLREQVCNLENLINYAPPSTGGPGYLAAKQDFESRI